jgi:hypothetical protein
MTKRNKKYLTKSEECLRNSKKWLSHYIAWTKILKIIKKILKNDWSLSQNDRVTVSKNEWVNVARNKISKMTDKI